MGRSWELRSSSRPISSRSLPSWCSSMRRVVYSCCTRNLTSFSLSASSCGSSSEVQTCKQIKQRQAFIPYHFLMVVSWTVWKWLRANSTGSAFRLCQHSPLLGGRTRCVVSLITSLKSSSSRMSMPVEEATLAPSGETERQMRGGKRDGTLIGSHFKHRLLLIIRLVATWSSWGKSRCTYTWFQVPFVRVKWTPLSRVRAEKSSHGACSGIKFWCNATAMETL